MGPLRFNRAPLIPCVHDLKSKRMKCVSKLIYNIGPMLIHPCTCASNFVDNIYTKMLRIGPSTSMAHRKNKSKTLRSSLRTHLNMVYIRARFQSWDLWAHHASTAPLWLHASMKSTRIKCVSSFVTYRIKCRWFTHVPMLPNSLTSYTLKCCGLAQVPPWHIRNIRQTSWDNHCEHTHTQFILEPSFDHGTCGLWAHRASTAPLWLHVSMLRNPQG